MDFDSTSVQCQVYGPPDVSPPVCVPEKITNPGRNLPVRLVEFSAESHIFLTFSSKSPKFRPKFVKKVSEFQTNNPKIWYPKYQDPRVKKLQKSGCRKQ